ncbi:MAG: glucose-1-phosphate cytidylyltransferase [Sediminibacterium sp.]|nr:glucose-1-phosphate cytidylyltransferase [Sediminibacterium sp.]
MQVVIFAGGLGTRISEETDIKPKPMIEIGGKPILWHIMKIYYHYGFTDFIICLGYKGYIIKEYFYHYFLHNSDMTIEVNNNKIEVHHKAIESFKITLIDTGLNTKTAGRLQQIKPYINSDNFMLTYGDGLADINIKKLVEFHLSHQKIVTVTAIPNNQRFGTLKLNENNEVTVFKEKNKNEEIQWINGGFFVLKKEIFNFIQGNLNEVMWEDAPLENLAKANQLVAYKHKGFWKCMDALRDKIELEELWNSHNSPWKIW